MNLKIKKYHFIPFILFLLVLNVGYAQAAPLATNPETGEYYTPQPNTGVFNSETNEMYPKADQGTQAQTPPSYYPMGQTGSPVVTPGTGDYYPQVGNGVINQKTGEYYPKVGPFYMTPLTPQTGGETGQ